MNVLIGKRGIQFSFAWIFAMIVGAFIIFLAIYASMKVADTGGGATSAKVGKEIGILLNPLQTGFGESTSNLLTLPIETRIHNRCSSSGNFGIQTIQVSQKNFGEWSATNLGSDFENKYIFSGTDVEGTDFFLFSKSFNFPFKVADVVYMTSSEEKFCFVGAPESIDKELRDLGQENIFLENCPAESVNVCFDSAQISGEDCDIEVRRGRKEVESDGRIVYFEDDVLMYAAIFSDADIYECQVQRLIKRTGELLTIYGGKQDLLAQNGCYNNLDLNFFRNSILAFRDSEDLVSVANDAESVGKDNDAEGCELW
ncbi:MAG: hypothetical protein KKB79_00620 [Nanoarchaeota archaeon]|nr:hypothetical protein [Nanoarchaeota archaeon]